MNKKWEEKSKAYVLHKCIYVNMRKIIIIIKVNICFDKCDSKVGAKFG